MLCKYRDIAGKPGDGIHSYRIFNIAIIDVIFTIIPCIAVALIFKINVWLCIVIGFLLGIIAHRVFCVNTTVNKAIFGKV